jgi:hypothetical protein
MVIGFSQSEFLEKEGQVNEQDSVKKLNNLVHRMKIIQERDRDRYKLLVEAGRLSNLGMLQAPDCYLMHMLGVVETHEGTGFAISQEMVEWARYYGQHLDMPLVLKSAELEQMREKLQQICTVSVEAVRQLEKLSRALTPAMVNLEQRHFDLLRGQGLIDGSVDDPLIPELVREFFRSFSKPAERVIWKAEMPSFEIPLELHEAVT